MKVVDFAWGRPGVDALHLAGIGAVVRYHSYSTTGKNLTRAEADMYRNADPPIDVVSNWEAAGSWTEYSGGASTGRQHATDFQRQHVGCGAPPGRPGYFSADFNPVSLARAVTPRLRTRAMRDVPNAEYAHWLGRMHPDRPEWADLTPYEVGAVEDHIAANTDPRSGQLATVADYHRGVNGVIGLKRDGAYGGFKTIRYLLDQGVITWAWQTYAWSGGQWDDRANLRQIQNGILIGGADCDLDTSMTADFGQWGAADMANNAFNAERYLWLTSLLEPEITGLDGAGTVHSALVDAIVESRKLARETRTQVADIHLDLTALAAAVAALAAAITAGEPLPAEQLAQIMSAARDEAKGAADAELQRALRHAADDVATQ